MNLKELGQPMGFKWRIQSVSKNYSSATCVAYIDARDCQDLLDKVCGPENWQADYKEVKGNLYCGVGIFINNQWVFFKNNYKGYLKYIDSGYIGIASYQSDLGLYYKITPNSHPTITDNILRLESGI